MIVAVASAIVMLALLDRAIRLERISTAQLKARFELFAVRDDLRRLERNGTLHADRWFSYMDTTLTRSAAAIEAITLWRAIGYLVTSTRRGQNIIATIDEAERVRKEGMKDRPELVAIHNRYDDCLRELFRARHALLWRILGLIGRAFLVVGKFRVKALKAVSGSPETSTLLDYTCHA